MPDFNRGAYHGPQSLRALATWVVNRMKRDDDAVIVISGRTGKGKSSLAILFAAAIDEAFDPDVQVLWSTDGLLEVARRLGEFRVLINDEAVVAGGNRRQSMAGDNIETMKHLNTCRVFHQALFFLAPEFEDLDQSIATRAKWCLNVTRRGEVEAFEIMKAGGVKSRSVYLTRRFVDKFPDPAVARPDLWQRYQDAKKRFSFRGADPKHLLKVGLVERYRAVIRAVLGPP